MSVINNKKGAEETYLKQKDSIEEFSPCKIGREVWSEGEASQTHPHQAHNTPPRHPARTG